MPRGAVLALMNPLHDLQVSKYPRDTSDARANAHHDARTCVTTPIMLPPSFQDLIGNTPAMFESQLRCWLRAACPRQMVVLRLPATETFTGVSVEVTLFRPDRTRPT